MQNIIVPNINTFKSLFEVDEKLLSLRNMSYSKAHFSDNIKLYFSIRMKVCFLLLGTIKFKMSYHALSKSFNAELKRYNDMLINYEKYSENEIKGIIEKYDESFANLLISFIKSKSTTEKTLTIFDNLEFIKKEYNSNIVIGLLNLSKKNIVNCLSTMNTLINKLEWILNKVDWANENTIKKVEEEYSKMKEYSI